MKMKNYADGGGMLAWESIKLKQPSELIFFSISIIAGVKSQTEIQIQIDSSHLITLPGTPVILRLDAKAICCDSLKLFAHWI